MNKDFKFKYSIVKPFKTGWAVFSIEPLHQKGYIWLRTRKKGSFLNIPMWTNKFNHEMKSKSLKFCKKLAKDYDEFYDNSEQF